MHLSPLATCALEASLCPFDVNGNFAPRNGQITRAVVCGNSICAPLGVVGFYRAHPAAVDSMGGKGAQSPFGAGGDGGSGLYGGGGGAVGACRQLETGGLICEGSGGGGGGGIAGGGDGGSTSSAVGGKGARPRQ